MTEDGKKIEAEKRELAQSAVARFVAEVGELDLSSEQIADLLRDIEEDLT